MIRAFKEHSIELWRKFSIIKKEDYFLHGEIQILSVIGVQTFEVAHIPGCLWETFSLIFFYFFLSDIPPKQGLRGNFLVMWFNIGSRGIRAKA